MLTKECDGKADMRAKNESRVDGKHLSEQIPLFQLTIRKRTSFKYEKREQSRQ